MKAYQYVLYLHISCRKSWQDCFESFMQDTLARFLPESENFLPSNLQESCKIYTCNYASILQNSSLDVQDSCKNPAMILQCSCKNLAALKQESCNFNARCMQVQCKIHESLYCITCTPTCYDFVINHQSWQQYA